MHYATPLTLSWNAINISPMCKNIFQLDLSSGCGNKDQVGLRLTLYALYAVKRRILYTGMPIFHTRKLHGDRGLHTRSDQTFKQNRNDYQTSDHEP